MVKKIMAWTSAVTLSLVLAGMAPSTVLAQSKSDEWQWRGTIYLWLPSVNGTTSMPADSGGTTVSADVDQILDSLDFAFMGQLEARKGRWGGFTDFIYLDFSNDKSNTRSVNLSGPGGIINVPANASMYANMDLKGLVWTLAGTYTAVEKPGYEMLVLGGVRYLGLDIDLNWQTTGNIGALPPVAQSGSASSKPDYWDAIIGVRGRADLGKSNWYVPYYVDIGTGNSNNTWQGALGLGYRFKWGEVTGAYRYLHYNFNGGEPLNDVSFGGFGLGVSWRW
jgi:hypothetical protein